MTNGKRTGHPSAERRWSWKLGTILGIDLYLHATFLVLLAWIAFSHLARGHGLSAAASGLALVLAVFATVVLHELGHALVARRFGIRTRDIILLPIGGVASLERMPEKPGQEILVALAGPGVNLVLALGLAAATWLLGGTIETGGMHVVGGSFLTKLLWINVSLAAFNLLPAFPMDGGRALRAALAYRMESARATEVAARVGQAMALVFGFLGLFANPMLLLIAVFVWMAAGQEGVAARARSALAGISIRRAMIKDFRTLDSAESLAHAALLVVGGFQHDFPVVHEGRLVGVLTRDDIVKGLADRGPDLPVAEAMRTEFATAAPGDMIEGAIGRFDESESPSVVVVEEGRVLGMLTPETIGEFVLVESALRGRSREARAT